MKYKQELLVVKRLVEHEEGALYELYSKYQSQILAFVSKKISDRQTAEEITQDVFVQLLESLRDFRFQCSLKTYIFTITRNKIVDYIRKKKIKKILFSTLPSFMVDNLTHFVEDDLLEKKELQQKFDIVLKNLPHDYQLILRLKYIDNKSVKHIAESLFKTLKATESLLFRARKEFVKIYTKLP